MGVKSARIMNLQKLYEPNLLELQKFWEYNLQELLSSNLRKVMMVKSEGM